MNEKTSSAQATFIESIKCQDQIKRIENIIHNYPQSPLKERLEKYINALQACKNHKKYLAIIKEIECDLEDLKKRNGDALQEVLKELEGHLDSLNRMVEIAIQAGACEKNVASAAPSFK